MHRLVTQHDVVAAPALTLLLHQLLPRKQVLLLEELIIFRSENDNQEFKLEHDAELYVDSKLGQQDKEFKAADLPRMNARLEHDVESPEHNKHGKPDQEFMPDDFTSRKK